MSGAWRSLVARMLWEHTFLLTRLIAITDFLTFITNHIVTDSDKLLVARVPLQLINYQVITSPTALERVNPKISKTTKPLRIRIALATSVSHTPCSVVSLTTTDAVFAK